MDFDTQLVSKVLDPIHGIIRLTDLEIKCIDHPLFQRLRTIKQNTFLYKVFPSAMHTRFEHSLGVMNLSYEILKHLQLNSYRFDKKNNNEHIFTYMDKLPHKNIQELRLAALFHDIGHGPMSHQFDSFLPKKTYLKEHIGKLFPDLFDMIDGEKIEHEHISLIFVKAIYDSLDPVNKAKINIDNVMKIIESKYMEKTIISDIEGNKIDILPMLTSIISSCPIDADRMDYLQRDGYFSGVKCGVYDFNRLFMSIVPVEDNNKLYLAYTESCIDSIAEFINARSNLFSQVYYHKTNRSFSSMMGAICNIASNNSEQNIFNFDELAHANEENKVTLIQNFYLKNSDSYFLNEQLKNLLAKSKKPQIGLKILDDLNNRKPWIKKYEAKVYPPNKTITDKVDKGFCEKIKNDISAIICNVVCNEYFTVDVMTDNAFKDIDKTEIKLLTKTFSGEYKLKRFDECGDKLNRYQSIKYFIRVFIDPEFEDQLTNDILHKIEECKNKFSSCN
jgi:HD superfamily phosphohydrolase